MSAVTVAWCTCDAAAVVVQLDIKCSESSRASLTKHAKAKANNSLLPSEVSVIHFANSPKPFDAKPSDPWWPYLCWQPRQYAQHLAAG